MLRDLSLMDATGHTTTNGNKIMGIWFVFWILFPSTAM